MNISVVCKKYSKKFKWKAGKEGGNLVDFKWRIVEELKKYKYETQDTKGEAICIEGYFQLKVNTHTWGVHATEPFLSGTDDTEDLLYMFTEFNKKILALKSGEICQIDSLIYYLEKLTFQRNGEMLFICAYKKGTDELRWTETINFRDFWDACRNSTQEFLSLVRETNPKLCENDYVSRLIQIHEEYSHEERKPKKQNLKLSYLLSFVIVMLVYIVKDYFWGTTLETGVLKYLDVGLYVIIAMLLEMGLRKFFAK